MGEKTAARIDSGLCTGCGRCAENCAVHAIRRLEDGTYQCRDLLCFSCGQCVAICPVGAAALPGLEEPVPYEKERFGLDPPVLLNAMRFRRSIRRFTGEKLTRQELETLLDAGRCAPTASNSQSVAFTVVDRDFEDLRAKLWEALARSARERSWTSMLRRYERYRADPAAPDTLFYGANQMIVVTSEGNVDGGLALANMELMAHAMGLGALYCGFAAHAIGTDPGLREFFGVSDRRHLDSCLVVGRTDLKFHRTAPRKPAQVRWR